MLKKHGKIGNAWRLLEKRMKEIKVPTRSQLDFTIASTASRKVARGIAREVMRQLEHIPTVIQQWVTGQMIIRVGKAGTFYDKRNTAGTVREMNFETARATMEQQVNEVFLGAGLDRIAGSAKIATQVPLVDTAEGSKEVGRKLIQAPQPPNIAPTKREQPVAVQLPALTEEWHQELTEARKSLPPEQQQCFDEYKEKLEDDEETKTAEDRSRKVSWEIARGVYEAVVLVACITALWVRMEDWTDEQCEYALKAWLAEQTIPPLRRTIGVLMRSGKRVTPYLYCSFKHKCWRGPHTHRKSHTKERHSCTRKIVSFVKKPGRGTNRLFHRASQTILQTLPSWEA